MILIIKGCRVKIVIWDRTGHYAHRSKTTGMFCHKLWLLRSTIQQYLVLIYYEVGRDVYIFKYICHKHARSADISQK